MYEKLANELQKSDPNVPEIIYLLAKGKPQNFFDKLFKGLFQSSALGIFYYSNSQENNFFHSSAQKGILSDILFTINRYQDDILRRECVSLDDLRCNLNAINKSGLTPAHIAIDTDPVALWWLMEFKAALTSHDYSKNILTNYSNKNINAAPLECIFKNDETVRNVFRQIIKSGNWEFFDLFEDESPQIQEKFKEYLKYIPQEVSNFKRSIAINSFSKLFQNHWQDILDEPEFSKIVRLTEMLEKLDWSSLGRNWDNVSKAKEHILTNCSLLYLNKFLDEDSPKQHITLENATLEQILNSPKFNNETFQTIKRYVENLSNDSADSNFEGIELRKKNPLRQKEDSASTKENSSSAANQLSDYISDSPEDTICKRPFDMIDFVADILGKLQKEHKEDLEEQSKKIKKTAKQIDKKFEINSQICTLISASSKKKIFQKAFNFSVENFEDAPFNNVNEFFKEYISKEYLHKQDHISQLLGYAYITACIIQNDYTAKLLIDKIIVLELQVEKKYLLFNTSFKLGREQIMKYLLSEDINLKIEWNILLPQTTRYSNIVSIKVIEHYIQCQNAYKSIMAEDSSVKEDTQHDAFNLLITVVRELIKSLGSHKESKSKIIDTIKTYKAVEALINEGNINYEVKDSEIVGKTLKLLNSFNEHSDNTLTILSNHGNEEMKENVELLISNFRELISNKYPKDNLYNEQVKQEFIKFESGGWEKLSSIYSAAPSVLSYNTLQKSEYDGSLVGANSVDIDDITS